MPSFERGGVALRYLDQGDPSGRPFVFRCGPEGVLSQPVGVFSSASPEEATRGRRRRSRSIRWGSMARDIGRGPGFRGARDGRPGRFLAHPYDVSVLPLVHAVRATHEVTRADEYRYRHALRDPGATRRIGAASVRCRLTPPMTPPRAQHAETQGDRDQTNRFIYTDSATRGKAWQPVSADCGSGGRGLESRRSLSRILHR